MALASFCRTHDPNAEITKTLFKTVRNKLHWAITKKTAAEIVAERADSSKRNMGLTTRKNAPKGSIRKSDVVVAKNYLDQREIRELERIVSMYLDFTDLQATRRIPKRMSDWVERLDAFLKFNKYEILNNPVRSPMKLPSRLPRVNTRSSVSSTIANMSATSKNRLSESEPDRNLEKWVVGQFGSLLHYRKVGSE